jgi:Tfp pilus assembly protein PilN
MNAVNLIPADSRKQRPTLAASPATLGLLGGLVVILAAAVLYVSAVNKVTQRKSELAQVTASAASWQAAANSFSSAVATAQQRAQQFSAVRDLAVARYPWEQLLSQLSGLMPAKSALTSMQASTDTNSATPTSSSTGAPAATVATAPLPAVQLAGCAASQSEVADTMVQLHKIQGVSAVLLSSSANTSTAASGGSGSSGSSGSSSGQGGCPFPVAFQVSLTFSAPAGATSAASATPTAATSPTPAAPAASTTPAATPATATSTAGTGAAQ